MKLLRNLLILTIFSGLFSCQKENIIQITSGNIEFSVSLNNTLKNVSADTSVNGPSHVILTVEDINGNVVTRDKSLSLIISENSCVTTPFSLDPGTYYLTNFMIVDNYGNTTHAIPMAFSSKSGNVSDPLPVKFIVHAGEITHLTPQVLNTTGYIAQDFGYTSFNREVPSDFRFFVNAYVLNQQTHRLEKTSASLIINSGNEISAAELNNSENSVLVKENSIKKYVLSVSKAGFKTWTDTLSETALLSYYSKPLYVFLEEENAPSFSFVTDQDSISRIYVTVKSSDQNPLIINWGDGQLESFDTNFRISHEYMLRDRYKVQVYGNIDAIYKIGLTQCKVISADLQKAKNLSSLEISRNPGLKSLNLSHMAFLKEVMCVEGGIENLILSGSDSLQVLHCSVNRLKTLDLSGKKDLKVLYCDRNELTDLNIAQNLNMSNIYLSNNNIDDDHANAIFESLYQNVKLNRRKGQLNMTFHPSEESKKIKEILEKEYGWIIYTN